MDSSWTVKSSIKEAWQLSQKMTLKNQKGLTLEREDSEIQTKSV